MQLNLNAVEPISLKCDGWSKVVLSLVKQFSAGPRELSLGSVEFSQAEGSEQKRRRKQSRAQG